MFCQDCGVEAATKHVAFYQNIGALVVRFPKSIEGRLCKSCIHKHFWSMTGTTMFLGWWGTISFCVTPFFILNNVGRYLMCLTMPGVPSGTVPAQLTDAEIQRIMPHADELFRRLNAGEEFAYVARYVAPKAQVTPGQLALFVDAVVRSQQQQQQ